MSTRLLEQSPLLRCAAAMALLIPSTRLPAQLPGTDSSINNLVQQKDAKTCPLGSLGHVEKRGAGPVPVVLIPGAAFGWRIWESFMAENSERYSMWAVTPPGYDQTPPPPMPPEASIADLTWTRALCDGILQLIEKERPDRPLLIAHHMMADHYALRLALEHPEKFRGIVVVSGRLAAQYSSRMVDAQGPLSSANPAQRLRIVQQFWVPFYRSVTPRTWIAGSFQANQFCRDTERADALFKEQIAVPVSTQVRYFLEYLTTDLGPQLSSLKVPLLVIQPDQQLTLESVIRSNSELYRSMYGDLEKAQSMQSGQMVFAWGSVEEGVKRMFDVAHPWELARSAAPTMRIEYVKDTGLFVMDDQPQRLSRLIADFAAGLQDDK